MKILRVRRGFTTNSSSYTEWLPPPSGQGQGNSATPPPAGGSPVPAVQGGSGAAPAQQSGSHLAGNTVTVLGILAALAAVFFGERLMRRLRRKREQSETDDD